MPEKEFETRAFQTHLKITEIYLRCNVEKKTTIEIMFMMVINSFLQEFWGVSDQSYKSKQKTILIFKSTFKKSTPIDHAWK